MLVVHRRHVKDCIHTSRAYRKCGCPIWFDWRIGKKRLQKPMGTADWQVAQLRAREMEATGIPRERSAGDRRRRILEVRGRCQCARSQEIHAAKI